MGLLDPLIAVIISFCFLGLLLYKRVNLGITLTATAITLAVLSLGWNEIPTVLYQTTADLLTISVVFATFGIMLLSQLYSETGTIKSLSESLSRIIQNPKVVITVLPAIIGFLPVGGGALMSAPLVDSEAEKLKLKTERKTYINLWFRHTIFPVYPLNQVLIVTAGLTGTTLAALIFRQIPVVIVMVTVGCLVGFWKTSSPKNEENSTKRKNSDFRNFIITFSPILTAIIVTVLLDMVGFFLAKYGFDVLIATFAGIIVLVAMTRMNIRVFIKPLRSGTIYGITLAAYGAFLLQNIVKATGISQIFQTVVANGSVDIILLLILMPGTLGFLTGSPIGGISLSISILSGVMQNFTLSTAALVYISCYFGYLIAPTHLCLTFTADYFKCPMGKIYKYIIPSVLVTFATAILTYYFIS